MFRFNVILLCLTILAGCGSVDSGSDGDSVARGGSDGTGSNNTSTTGSIEDRLPAAESVLTERVNTVVAIQDDVTSSQDMTGTWVEFWVQVGRSESELSVDEVLVEAWQIDGFEVISLEDSGSELKYTSCFSSQEFTIAKTLENGQLATLDHPELGVTSVEFAPTGLVKFEDVAFNFESPSEKDDSVQLTFWVKVNDGTEQTAGTISQNSGEVDFNCGKLYLGKASFSDGRKRAWHWVELVDFIPQSYSSISDQDNTGETLGDPPLTVSGNEYQVLFNGINSIVTID